MTHLKLIIYNVNISLSMGIGKPTSKTLVNRAGVLLSQRSLQRASQWSTATSSSSARVAHPPNVAAILGNVPRTLLLMPLILLIYMLKGHKTQTFAPETTGMAETNMADVPESAQFQH